MLRNRVYEFIERKKARKNENRIAGKTNDGSGDADKEFDIEKVLTQYDDTAKRRWMEARLKETLEMKQKMHNQSMVVVRQQNHIAALVDTLKDTQKDVSEVTKSKQGAVRSDNIANREKYASEQTMLIKQLNAAQEKITEQHTQIEKLRKKAQAKNCHRLNQTIEPLPEGVPAAGVYERNFTSLALRNSKARKSVHVDTAFADTSKNTRRSVDSRAGAS